MSQEVPFTINLDTYFYIFKQFSIHSIVAILIALIEHVQDL